MEDVKEKNTSVSWMCDTGLHKRVEDGNLHMFILLFLFFNPSEIGMQFMTTSAVFITHILPHQ